MLEVAADSRENQGFIVLEFVAKQSLNLLNILSSLNGFFPGYKRQVSMILLKNLCGLLKTGGIIPNYFHAIPMKFKMYFLIHPLLAALYTLCQIQNAMLKHVCSSIPLLIPYSENRDQN